MMFRLIGIGNYHNYICQSLREMAEVKTRTEVITSPDPGSEAPAVTFEDISRAKYRISDGWDAMASKTNEQL